jgi:hypothetical protein
MAVATRTTVRDPLADHLITLQNSAMVLIDYQPSQSWPPRTAVTVIEPPGPHVHPNR